MCACFFFPFLLCEVLEMKEVVFQKWCSRSTPALTPGIAHVAPWPRGRVVGVRPSARPPFYLSFSLFVCHTLSSSQSLTLFFASLSAPAARRSSTAAVRPLAEASMRAVSPYYAHERKEEMEDGVSERQKRGTRCACAARAWLGGCVNCEEWARSLHM